MLSRLKRTSTPAPKPAFHIPTLSRSEFITRERAICDPTATRDLIITSIISTCRFTSAGSDSLTTPHVLSSLSLTTPLFAADSVDTLNSRSASFTSSTVASGDSRIFASASAMRMMASS